MDYHEPIAPQFSVAQMNHLEYLNIEKRKGLNVPQKKRAVPAKSERLESPDVALQLERITKLLALLAAKGESQANQILMLNAIGFTASEIASLLGTTPNTVSVTVYQHKTGRTKTKSRKK